jgi:signal transduction histidine kinase
LRDLATEAGGTLQVTSSPGAGTTVMLEVPTR